jgi:hypothetical protein
MLVGEVTMRKSRGRSDPVSHARDDEVTMATSTMAAITTQKYTSSVKRPSLKFIPITPAISVPGESAPTRV